MKKVETWVIKNKKTGEVITLPSGKSSWAKAGSAKSAWGYMGGCLYDEDNVKEQCAEYDVQPVPNERGRLRFPLFDEQSTYELVNLSVSNNQTIAEYSRLLTECVDKLYDSELNERIKAFLNING